MPSRRFSDMTGAPSPTLAIDIGTTTIVATTWANHQSAVVLRAPATVAVDGSEILFGDRAQSLVASRPEATVQQLIRRVGDTSPIVLDGRAFSVVELLARVVSDVASIAEVAPTSARLVLTHPAGWRDHRLELLASIGRSVGFAEVDVVSEPVAAASTQPPGSVLLVVDVGGGTADASVVRTTPTGVEVVVTQSLERLGGNDFDQAVFAHVCAAVDDMLGALDRRDPAVRAGLTALRRNCSAAKEQLSADTDGTVELSVPGVHTTVRITRAEFETLIRPQVGALVAMTERVLASAGIAPNDITDAVVVGGSAPIPLIGEMLAGQLGRRVTVVSDPAVAVASAAAAIIAVADPEALDNSTAATTANERDELMNDETASTPPPADGASDRNESSRRTPPAPPPKSESGSSTGAKVAAGAAAAAAAAVVGGVVFRDEVAEALDDAAAAIGIGGDDGDDNMDAFDEVAAVVAEGASAGATSADVAPAASASGDGGVAASGPAGVTIDPVQAARSVSQPAADDGDFDVATAPIRPLQTRPQREVDVPAQREAEVRPQRDADLPAQPAPAAAVANAGPAPTGDVVTAVAASAAVTDEVPAPAPAPAPAQQQAPLPTDDRADDAFETARATLLERLDTFEVPPGTSPEDAAELRQDLADAVARFEPRPGQTTDEALAEMRDDFDDRVRDFVQDQKIEALVNEVERNNRADAEAEAEAALPTAVDTDVSVTDVISPEPPVSDVSDGGLEDDFDAAADQFTAVSVPAVVDTAPVDASPVELLDVGDALYVDLVSTSNLPVDALAPVEPPVIDFDDPVLVTDDVPQIPDEFDMPVYIEPEPVGHLDTSTFSDDGTDFGVQGLEDEGDSSVLDDKPDLTE